MNYHGDLCNVNDEYLRLAFYHALREGMTFPVYAMHCEHSIDKIETDSRFVLMLTGNENHDNLDRFYDDKRVISIIKNYPAMPNIADPDDENVKRSYEFVYNSRGIPVFITEEEDPRTFNIPLGYCNNFVPIYSSNKHTEGGFIGQWSQNRGEWAVDIQNYFESAGDNSPFSFGFYEGFGPFVREDDSLPIDQYSHHLSQMKTAFCFSGQSPETFRLIETVMSGCVVVSTPLPDIWYYNNLPALITPEFDKNSVKVILEKINGHSELLLNALAQWYLYTASPSAVGRKISEHIQTL